MKRDHTVRHRIEAFLFDVAMVLIPRMPRAVVVATAQAASIVAWVFDRRDRRIAMANLDLAFGEALDRRAKRRIVVRSFRTFAQVGLDYFWFARNSRERVERYVTGDATIRRWLGRQSAIAVTAHFGNWEILGQWAALNGTSLVSVAKPIRNPRIDRRVNVLRQKSGQRIVAREGALKNLLRVLRGGGTVALLLDQDTRVEEGGVFVNFFGVPAPVSSAAARLADKTEVPIVFAFCRREEGGRYTVYAQELLTPESFKGLSAEVVTQRIASRIEEEIRRYPDQWLWMYKRWKRRLPGFDVRRYPFYADC